MFRYMGLIILGGFVTGRILQFLPIHLHASDVLGVLVRMLTASFRNFFPDSKNDEIAAGLLLEIVVLLIAAIIPGAILLIAATGGLTAYSVTHFVLAVILFSENSSLIEMAVINRLFAGGHYPAAGRRLGRMLRKNTRHLTDEELITCACAETAKSISRDLIAPLFYASAFTVCGGYVFLAASVLDRELGHRNKQYLYFGKIAALFEDVLNYIPARLGALFLMIAAVLLRMHPKHAIHTWKHDRHHHKGINEGEMISVCAGAIGISMGEKVTGIRRPANAEGEKGTVNETESDKRKVSDGLTGVGKDIASLPEALTIGTALTEPTPDTLKQARKLSLVADLIAAAVIPSVSVLFYCALLK